MKKKKNLKIRWHAPTSVFPLICALESLRKVGKIVYQKEEIFYFFFTTQAPYAKRAMAFVDAIVIVSRLAELHVFVACDHKVAALRG